MYTRPDTPISKNYIKYYKEQGINFKEKDLNLHNEIVATVQLNAFPIIFVNDTYLVQGRDFHTPPQSIGVLRHYADPDYVSPSLE